MKNFRSSFVPGIVWLLIVTVLLVLPGSAFPQENWLSKIWFDKWVHIGLFAVMVALWCRALLRQNYNDSKLKRGFIITALLSLLYGIAMEFVQKYFVVNRSFDGGDIIADGLGCLAGYIFSLMKYIKK